MSFGGWPEAALDFYEGLEADNSKTYWTRHKAVYEEQVLGPMTELLADLAPGFGETKIFRPYRDLRFSKDKTPYKTHIGALVGSGYVQLSAAGLGVGNGTYHMAPDQLDRYRRAVASDGTGSELERVIAGLEEQEIEVFGSDPLRGYPADHPRIGLLRYKGLVAWKQWQAEPWLGTPAAGRRVAGVLTATRPLTGWLDRNVGPSAAPGHHSR
jgi:uncharacterized protein (TIGR02453 family)